MRAIVALIVILLSGCASFQSVDLVENHTTDVATESSDELSVNTIFVKQYVDAVYVKGRVTRDKDERFTKGFVTVDLYNERGVRIDSVDTTISFKRTGPRTLRSGTFSVQLEEIPQKNSRVVVTAHDKRKPNENNNSDGSLEIM